MSINEQLQNRNPEFASKQQTVDFSSSKSLAKVFFYAFIGVLVTALVTLAAGYGVMALPEDSRWTVFIIAIIISAFAILIIPFVMRFLVKRRPIALWIPYIIYAVAFGIFLSVFAIFLKPLMLALAFGITALSFGSMALIGIVTKGKIKVFFQILSGLSVGIMLIGIAALILFFVPGLEEVNSTLYLIILGAVFLYSMIITIVDVNRIKRTLDSSPVNENMALLFAFNIYTDFVIIFYHVIRILIILALSSRKK